jgi:hypothetical protein
VREKRGKEWQRGGKRNRGGIDSMRRRAMREEKEGERR